MEYEFHKATFQANGIFFAAVAKGLGSTKRRPTLMGNPILLARPVQFQ